VIRARRECCPCGPTPTISASRAIYCDFSWGVSSLGIWISLGDDGGEDVFLCFLRGCLDFLLLAVVDDDDLRCCVRLFLMDCLLRLVMFS